MSTSVDTAFVRQYEREVHEVFQRRGSFLLQSIRRKTNIVGTSTTFQRVGTGVAVTKSRHGVVTPMNQSHTAIVCTMVDFYAGDFVDKLDELKIQHDERMVIANGGAFALGRKADNQILTILNSTTQATVTLTVTSSATVVAGILEMARDLIANDVPNDGMIFGLLTPTMWAQLMTVTSFGSADFVGPDGLPFVVGAPVGSGSWKRWMNVNWLIHTDLPGVGTATANCYVYHKTAVGYGSGADITADITWEGPRVAHWVNHFMSGGACLIDDAGVIEGQLDDTAPIVTS